MNDNVRKVFDMLGVEPNEKFKIEGNGDTIYRIDEELYVYRDDEILCSDKGLNNLINGYFKIIKLPKTKKLRDLTKEEYNNYCKKNNRDCSYCPCYNVHCIIFDKKCWFHHKDLYSDKFLNQEIEVEE